MSWLILSWGSWPTIPGLARAKGQGAARASGRPSPYLKKELAVSQRGSDQARSTWRVNAGLSWGTRRAQKRWDQ